MRLMEIHRASAIITPSRSRLRGVFRKDSRGWEPTRIRTRLTMFRPSRPDRIGSGELSNPTIAHWFDTPFGTPGAAWANPAIYTYGNGGRNILRGPGRTNIDGSIFKVARFKERYGLQFRAEFFNLLNHPQFDLPNGTVGSAAAGTISSTVGSPRDIQFSLRLSF